MFKRQKISTWLKQSNYVREQLNTGWKVGLGQMLEGLLKQIPYLQNAARQNYTLLLHIFMKENCTCSRIEWVYVFQLREPRVAPDTKFIKCWIWIQITGIFSYLLITTDYMGGDTKEGGLNLHPYCWNFMPTTQLQGSRIHKSFP